MKKTYNIQNSKDFREVSLSIARQQASDPRLAEKRENLQKNSGMTDEEMMELDAKIIRHVLIKQTFLMPTLKIIAVLVTVVWGLGWIWNGEEYGKGLGFERNRSVDTESEMS